MTRPERRGDWQTYRRLLGYVRPYWPLFILAIAGYAMGGAAEAWFVRMFGDLVDGWQNNTSELARSIPLLIVAAAILRGCGEILGEILLARISFGVVHRIRTALFDQLLRMPSAFFDASSQGHLVSRLTYNVGQLRDTGTDALKTVLQDGAKVIIYLAYMLWLSWKLTLIFAATAPLVGLIVIRASRSFRRQSRRIQTSMGDVTHVASEAVSGYRVVRIFGGEAYERERFHRSSERNQQQNLRMVATKVVSTHVIQMFVAAALALLVLLLLRPEVAGELSTGQIVTLLGLAGMLARPIRKLTEVNARLQRGLAAAEDIFEQLDQPAEADRGMQDVARVKGRIEFRGVSFAYPRVADDAHEPERVLKDIDLVIEPGTTVALVGRSGSGKSTFASLLPRFHEPTQGQILLDGVPLASYRLAALRRQIAWVTQQVTLFNDTLERNVAYGALAGASREQIDEAVRRAHADVFIRDLPAGLATLVGDDGVLLSGGQRQRIAIARALLKDAPILVLDEATSALDTESERHIQAALEAVMHGRTTLVIAHRLSTIERADRIVVMQDGRIAETGTHAELLARRGAYAALHAAQFRDGHEAASAAPAAPAARPTPEAAASALRPFARGEPFRWSAQLSRVMLRAWYERAAWLLLLAPFGHLFAWVAQRRRLASLSGRSPVWRAPVPVIIVGNLTVGGTGKTPLVIWLAARLQRAGHRPGIVSRGYLPSRSRASRSAGGRLVLREPIAVTPDSDPAAMGDEPVLLAVRTGCPVWVGADRVAAVQALLAAERCTVVISDDGLQHYALGRDVEIAVVDGLRGLGNGRCLPAGPLREPPERLATVDWIVQNGGHALDHIRSARMDLLPLVFVDVVTGERLVPQAFVERLTQHRLIGAAPSRPEVRALAGIGHPERFFRTLRELGLTVITMPRDDHDAFVDADALCAEAREQITVCTEKDAVKLRQPARQSGLPPSCLWYLEVAAAIDSAEADALDAALHRHGITSVLGRESGAAQLQQT